MTLDAVTSAVHHLDNRLRTEFGVAALSVFGSVARGGARPDSDIDVLVEFDGPPTFARFMDLKALPRVSRRTRPAGDPNVTSGAMLVSDEDRRVLGEEAPKVKVWPGS